MVIEVVEIEPAGKLAFAEGAEAEVEIEEVAQTEEGEGEAHAVDLVEVDHGVGSDGIQHFINLDEALFLLHSQILHIVHACEEGLKQWRPGDGETDAGVGDGVVVHQRCHEGYVAEGGESNDKDVFHFCRR